uniref:NB-ARC domain-containing protein n=1 Tax=Leersia perrieri TaxID=77586 RepID=A0A0D9XZ61_9ORYZ
MAVNVSTGVMNTLLAKLEGVLGYDLWAVDNEIAGNFMGRIELHECSTAEDGSHGDSRYSEKGAEEQETDDISPVLCGEANRLVAIGVPRDVIVRLLTEDIGRESGQLLKVVSIVGHGGLGKTTLASQVYNKIEGIFDCTMIVPAFRNRSISMILHHILWKVTNYGFDKEQKGYDIQSPINATRENLACKRFFIVIDDISSLEVWNSISGVFVENNRGSRIITTTRSEDVANACCSSFCGIVYKMNPLDWTDSRSLFFRRIYGSENYSPEPKELIIAVDILKKCGAPVPYLPHGTCSSPTPGTGGVAEACLYVVAIVVTGHVPVPFQ